MRLWITGHRRRRRSSILIPHSSRSTTRRAQIHKRDSGSVQWGRAVWTGIRAAKRGFERSQRRFRRFRIWSLSMNRTSQSFSANWMRSRKNCGSVRLHITENPPDWSRWKILQNVWRIRKQYPSCYELQGPGKRSDRCCGGHHAKVEKRIWNCSRDSAWRQYPEYCDGRWRDCKADDRIFEAE